MANKNSKQTLFNEYSSKTRIELALKLQKTSIAIKRIKEN